jgi:hypothetical protein
MTNWKVVAADFRTSLRKHAAGCDRCFVGNGDHVLVSDQCHDGAMLLSEVVLADMHAAMNEVKKEA